MWLPGIVIGLMLIRFSAWAIRYQYAQTGGNGQSFRRYRLKMTCYYAGLYGVTLVVAMHVLHSTLS